jgi:uncharacterized OsmC-like protein
MPYHHYSDKERRIIEAVPNQCPVGNSLHPDIDKDVTIVYP